MTRVICILLISLALASCSRSHGWDVKVVDPVPSTDPIEGPDPFACTGSKADCDQQELLDQ